MKSSRLFALAALCVAVVFSVSSCRKTPGNRRPEGGDVPGPDKKEYVDNPSWNLTYTGREVDVDKDGTTLLVDPIYMASNDKLSYFIDLITLDEYKKTYKSSPASYIEGSFKNNFEKEWVESGDSRASFNVLDAGDGSWVAIAYEITSDNKLGSKYSLCQFKTKAVTMRQDKSYELSYSRKTVNGVVVDVISSNAHSDYSYYIDITYPEFLEVNYDGNPVEWINARLDDIAAGLNEGDNFNSVLSYGNDAISFDRLRHGDWTAYAFGCDINGNLTGNWSKLDFDVAEEAASADFRKWLGTWTIGGKSNDGKNNKFYTINVRSAENNLFYSIEDWENIRDFIFETEFDPGNGSMWFTSQFLGSDYYDDYKSKDNVDGGYDIAFVGNIDIDGDIYSIDYIDGQYDIAQAKISGDGKSASVVPEYVTIKIDKQNYTEQYCSMQYVDWTWDGYIATYNKTIPLLPMTMTKIAGPDGTMASVSMPRPAAKKVAGASEKATASAAGKATASAAGKAAHTNAADVELQLTTGARQAAGTSALRSSAVRNSSGRSSSGRSSATAVTKSTSSVLDVSIPGAPRNAVKISGNEARHK